MLTVRFADRARTLHEPLVLLLPPLPAPAAFELTVAVVYSTRMSVPDDRLWPSSRAPQSAGPTGGSTSAHGEQDRSREPQHVHGTRQSRRST